MALERLLPARLRAARATNFFSIAAQRARAAPPSLTAAALSPSGRASPTMIISSLRFAASRRWTNRTYIIGTRLYPCLASRV